MCFTEGALSSCEVFGIGNPEHNAGVSHGATERRAARLAARRCSLHSFQPAFGTPFSHAHTHKTQPKGSSSRRPSAQPSEPRGAAQSARWAGTEGRPAPLRSVPQAAASAAGTAPLRRRTLRLPVGASRPDGIAAGPSGQPSWAGALRVPRNGSRFCQESLSAERGRSAGRVPTEKSVTAISSVLFGPERKAQ